jgi:hypothetical protein
MHRLEFGCSLVCLIVQALDPEQAQYDDEEHRHQENCQHRGTQHAADHAGARRIIPPSRFDEPGKQMS